MVRKLKVLLFSVIVFAFVFLVGCTNQTYEITVNEDNSCDMTLTLITDIDNYNLLSSYNINTENKIIKKESSANGVEQCDVLFQEAASIFYNKGFDIEPLSDAVQVGFTAKKHYINIESLNKDIKDLYETGYFGLNIEISHNESITSNSYSVDGSFKYYVDPALKIPDELIADINSLTDVSNLSANLYITLPGDVSSTNGKASSGGISWTSNYEKDLKEQKVELQASSANITIVIIIAIPITIAGMIVLLFVLRKMRSAKDRKNQKLQEE